MSTSRPAHKIVFFTTPRSTPGRDVLLERLVATDGIEVCAVVSDSARTAILGRTKFLWSKWGGLELFRSAFVAGLACVLRVPASVLQKWHDFFIPPKLNDSLAAFCAQRSIPLIVVKNINSDESVAAVRHLNADLGVIFGGRILKERVFSLPRLGTLNIHKHDARKYRGGGQIGFIERANGDSHLGVTIHFATAKVDAGAIVEYRDIEIEKFDNHESLALKADAVGVAAYYSAICLLLNGKAELHKQDINCGKTYFSTPHWKRLWFWSKMKKAHHIALRRSDEPLWRSVAQRIYALVRLAAFYLALPYLSRRMRHLSAQGKAPITILYYHGVGNGAENWMTLPVETFWRQVDYAKRYYEIISLSEAVARLRSGQNFSPALVLTFDDGYASCHKNLLPLCKTFNIPASLFVCAESAQLGLRLEHDLSKGYSNAVLMNMEEIKECAAAGLEIGSHTMRHEIMSSLSPARAHYVLEQSKLIISSQCGVSVNYFSFPKGTPRAINQDSLLMGAQMYDALFSAYGGYNFPGDIADMYFQRIANPTDDFTIMPILAGLHRFRPFYTRHSSVIPGITAQAQAIAITKSERCA
ncbi:MAG: polysaccharide deacetylase family protein [Oligoflexia bacterium]|nr:polysaccharide deacetylase family protein [Oligoflexia bacterium]